MEALEARLGVALPESYRSFLAASNGGRPERQAFAVPNHAEGFFEIQEFFGVSRDVQTSNIDWNAKAYRGVIPAALLPIACDSCGSLICLGLGEEAAGRIYFWDCEEDLGDGSWLPTYEVAHSFDAFVAALTVYPGS
ncbi:MAG: SMI1/KNR4 family protein [Hyphomicrobiaceae bacterium]